MKKPDKKQDKDKTVSIIGWGKFKVASSGEKEFQESFNNQNILNNEETAVSAQNPNKIGDNVMIEYKIIGEQEWMTENLNVSTFRNGDPILETKSDEEWISAGKEGIPAWCYYDNDPENGDKYGKLFNWYAVGDPRGLAPEGWHVPTDEEWTDLIDFLGGGHMASIKMMSIKESDWDDEWTGNNESGFNGIPGGIRTCELDVPEFMNKGYTAFYWSSSQYATYHCWYRSFPSEDSGVYRDADEGGKEEGMAVRCIKN